VLGLEGYGSAVLIFDTSKLAVFVVRIRSSLYQLNLLYFFAISIS
jgi:hypothetical protein